MTEPNKTTLEFVKIMNSPFNRVHLAKHMLYGLNDVKPILFKLLCVGINKYDFQFIVFHTRGVTVSVFTRFIGDEEINKFLKNHKELLGQREGYEITIDHKRVDRFGPEERGYLHIQFNLNNKCVFTLQGDLESDD